jgi:hypothetical protein
MKTILFTAACGLANRLRALVGCRVLADALGAPLYVDWVANGACSARFDELFEYEGWEKARFVGTSEFERLRRNEEATLIIGEPWFTEIWASHGRSLSSEADFHQQALMHLRRLRPERELQARVDSFLAEHELAACTGVHIRSTDNVHDYEVLARSSAGFDREKISRLEGFMALIDARVAAGERVFLCTDNQSVEKQIRARHEAVSSYSKAYDTRGFERHVKRNYERFGLLHRAVDLFRAAGARPAAESSWRTTSVGDGLIDLLLLSRCREIVGTYYSSFSEISALIGDVPLAMMEGNRSVPHAFTERIRKVAAGAREG